MSRAASPTARVVAGRPPHERALDKFKEPVPPRPSAFGAPTALDEVLLRGLSRERDDRYPSADAFSDACLEALR